MKVTFEFDTLSENFDHSELERIKQVDNLTSALYEITSLIREWYKYDSRNAIPVEEISEKVWDIINEKRISLEELWS